MDTWTVRRPASRPSCLRLLDGADLAAGLIPVVIVAAGIVITVAIIIVSL